MAYSINSFPTITTTTHNVQHPSTPIDNIKMPQKTNVGEEEPMWLQDCHVMLVYRVLTHVEGLKVPQHNVFKYFSCCYASFSNY